VNATHVRQLLAFWVLASTTAFITTAGLSAPDSPPVRLGASSAASGAGPSPEPSAGVGRSQPTQTSVGALLLPRVWSSAAAAEHSAAGIGVVVPAPGGLEITGPPTTAVAAPGGQPDSGGSSTGSGGSGGSGTGAIAARPTTSPTEDSAPGRGKGHEKADGHAHVPGSGATHPGKGRGH
jgi:hypothetical protein